MKSDNFLYHTNDYGVREYHNMPILFAAFVVFMIVIFVAAYYVLYFEKAISTANITNYRDAFWLSFMAASTIGFGDFYPMSDGGRLIIGSMFIAGGVMLGTIIGIVGNMIMGFTDTEAKNYELRKQNADILQELKSAKEKYQKADLENGEDIKRQLSDLQKTVNVLASNTKTSA